MITFKAQLQKFGSKREKTGWTYIDIPEKLAQKIKPNCKKSFRVKGKIDDHIIKALALTPVGDGNFILAINAEIRKSIKKIHGASVEIHIEEDADDFILNKALITCLNDEPAALNYFNSLPSSHQKWFSNWVKSVKGEATITKRIAVIVSACSHKISFSDMMKSYKDDNILIR